MATLKYSVTLVNSNICRICAAEYNDGFSIFEESEDKASLVILINKYLPITVVNDGVYPACICERCHMGVAATVDLIDRMVEGQHSLRAMIQKLPHVCSPPATAAVSAVLVDLQGACLDVPMDDLAKGSEAVKVYDSAHPLSQSVAGTVVKRKRGRPKSSKNKVQPLPPVIDAHSRPKRRAVMPQRFRDTVAGEALDQLVIGSPHTVGVAEPSIFVAGEGTGAPADVPFALNIEIIEKDGSFILRDLEQLGDLKQLCSIKVARNYQSNNSFPHSSNIPVLEAKVPNNQTQGFIIGADDLSGTNLDFSSLRPDNIGPHQDIPEANTLLQGQTTLDISASQQMQTFQFDSSSPSLLSSSLPSLMPPPPAPPQKREDSSQRREISSITVANNPGKVVQHRKCNYRRRHRFKCNICGKTFLRQKGYKQHMLMHTTSMVQCIECKQQFDQQQQLEQHQQQTQHKGFGILESTTGESNFNKKCKICRNKVFTSYFGYKKHMSSVHENGNKKLGCDQCNKKFVYPHSLRSHVLKAHINGESLPSSRADDREYPCEVCGKIFNHSTSLSYHMDTTHVAGRFFVCSVCDAPFKHKQLLQRHYSVHSNVRPFICTVCGKAFKSRSNLVSHMVVHNKEKHYTCELCGKQFNHLTSISLHIRSHTGMKPFACPHCDKKFAQNGNLQEHIRIHTGERPYACTICDRRFTTSSQMRHHSQMHNKKLGGAVKERKIKPSTTTTPCSSNILMRAVAAAAAPDTAAPIGHSSGGSNTCTSDQSGAIAEPFYTRMCSQCYETLPDDAAIASHRCQSAHLQPASHTWLMTEAVAPPPQQHGNATTGGCNTVIPEPLVERSNVIYILADKDGDTGHTFNAMQQGEVQLVQQGVGVGTVAGGQCWAPQGHDTTELQLYSGGGVSGSAGMCQPGGVHGGGLLQPLITTQQQQIVQSVSLLGAGGGGGVPLKEAADQPVTLLLAPHPQQIMLDQLHHQPSTDHA